MSLTRRDVRRPFLLRGWGRTSNGPEQQLRNAAEIEKRLDVLGLSPEEIFEKTLSADEEMYTKNDFKELVRLVPRHRRALEPLVKLPIDRLNRHEKITVLLSRIGCLGEKVQLMSTKKKIRITIYHIKIILGWAIKASEVIKRKDFLFVVSVINYIAAEEGITYPSFRFRALPMRTTEGNLFMDDIARAVLGSDYDYTAFARDPWFSERARHVPPIFKIRQTIREMLIDINNMGPVMNTIAKVSTHPNDKFYNLMRIFIVETNNNIKALYEMTYILEAEFRNLCKLYSVSESAMPIGDFFDEAVIFTRMFRNAARRVEQNISSNRSSIYSSDRSSISSSGRSSIYSPNR